MKIFLTTIFFIISIFPVQSQNKYWIPPEKEYIDTVIDVMYNMEFVKAEKMISVYMKNHPERPEGPFIDGMILWTQILVDIWNPYLDEEFQKKMDNVIEICGKMEKNDSLGVVAGFYKSGAIGFKARAFANREKYFQTTRYGLKAMDGIEEALEGKYQNVDAKFGAGIFYYFADVIPKDYPFVKPLMWFYPKGDKEKGIKLLQTVADSGLFAKIESKYYLGIIYDIYEKDYTKAWVLFKELSDRYPQNARFLFRRGVMAYRIGKYWDSDSSFATIEQRIRRGDPLYYTHQTRYIAYYRGIIAQQQGKYDLAYSFYEEALKPVDAEIEKETDHYVVYCTLRSADMLRKLGDEKEAIKRYEKVLTLKDYSDSHKNAKKALGRE